MIETFLPAQLSDDELDNLVAEAITEVGASSPADMGKVMKVLASKLQGRAPSDRVSQVVRRKLSTL